MKSIIALTDLTDSCKPVIALSEELAKGMGWRLYVMHVVPPHDAKGGPAYVGNEVDDGQPRRDAAAALKELRHKLHAQRDELIARGVDCHAVMVEGQLEEKLLKEVDAINPEFVIIGRHCHDMLYKVIFGNRSDKLLDKLKQPLMVVPLPK
ncbi:universal stress protein [Magnetofaba australis]|uniref:Putative UspA domain-containing protein n=1 Tax=Magnetofaba australis IT-1 TaxID=1434232 RepID=A0A1Y2K4C2_9PROT|nr:universal stress protein [Magnetofaba australis]OSM04079.1 putative UspA domain-containing protein [Magnetofaba australis IT-1]